MSGGWPPHKWSVRPRGFDDVPELSAEEVERRVDGRGGSPGGPVEQPIPEWRQDPRPEVAPGPDFEPTPVTLLADPVGDRRRILWRDSATILIGVVLALLAVQVLAPSGDGGPSGSASAIPSGIAIGSLAPPASLPPGVTFGPIIDPNLGIDATPTPIPVITMGPSPSPSPSPSPTPRITPKPTPTAKPSGSPKPPSPAPSTQPTESLPPSLPPTDSPPPTDPPPSEPPLPSLPIPTL